MHVGQSHTVYAGPFLTCAEFVELLLYRLQHRLLLSIVMVKQDWKRNSRQVPGVLNPLILHTHAILSCFQCLYCASVHRHFIIAQHW